MSAGFLGRARYLLGRAFVSFGLGAHGTGSGTGTTGPTAAGDTCIRASASTVTTITVELGTVTCISSSVHPTTTIDVSLRECC